MSSLRYVITALDEEERTMTASQTPAGDIPTAASAPPSRRSGYVAFVVIVSFLAWALVSMDQTILGVAVPSLSDTLGVSLSTMEYLVRIFAFLTFAAPVLGGRLIDRLGRRWGFHVSLLGTWIFGGLTAVVGVA